MEHELSLAKNRKVVGPNEIPNEIIKLMDEGNVDRLTGLLNKIYDTGEIPEQ